MGGYIVNSPLQGACIIGFSRPAGNQWPMHAFHQLYYHLIWATQSRQPLIDRNWRSQLLAILNDEVKKRGGWPIRHNAMPDHVHLLVRLPPTVTVSKFLGEVKGATSFRVNRDVKPAFKLHWQEGYGALSIRKEEVEPVSRYIDNQERHHSNGKVSELLEMSETEGDDWPEDESEAP
jgi:putative transposase